MSAIAPYLSDLHDVLSPPVAGTVIVLTSMLAGTIVGWERRKRDKPAGLRTMMLIAVGSTIFTLSSIMIAGDSWADRGRIAAQIVSGIGFLGAGAIIRDRGEVRGLTTGATIWVVAAIGVMIGAGYAAAGLALTFLVVAALTLFRHDEGHDDGHGHSKPSALGESQSKSTGGDD